MDPLTTVAVVSVGATVVKLITPAAQAFFTEVTKPLGTEIGNTVAEKYRSYAADRQVELYQGASDKHEKHLLTATPVGLKLLVPLVANASIEDVTSVL